MYRGKHTVAHTLWNNIHWKHISWHVRSGAECCRMFSEV